MLNRRRNIRCLLKGGALWLGAWLCVMPLVHVHPEADHRHGLPGHVHGGTFHTIFSPELACASRAPAAQDEAPVLSASPPDALPLFGGGAHLGDHPTIGFSLLTAKATSVFVHQAVAASVESHDGFPTPAEAASAFNAIPENPRRFFSAACASRAPPRHASA